MTGLSISAQDERTSSLAGGDRAPKLEVEGEVTERQVEEYATGAPLAALVASLMLGMFLVALDNTIVSTAIPKITDEFRDLSRSDSIPSDHDPWKLLLNVLGLQSTWGKLFKYFPIKLWYLIAMFVFELGSLVCAVAQSSTSLIVGRAIQGLSGSGVTVGLFTIVGFAAAPKKRPQYLGILGAIYAIAAVLGPLLGGAFTTEVTWRWCFYVNLPLGGLAAIITLFFFNPPANAKPVQAPLKEKLLHLDLVGAALVMSLLVSYVLALYSVVIGLLVGFVAILGVFILWEMYQKEYAMIVPRILIKYLAIHLPGVDTALVLETGATQIRDAFSAEQVPVVVRAYISGLKIVFAITTAAFGIATVVAPLGNWKKLDEEAIKKAGSGAV
ncbi:hypothetical protein LTR85_011782 [Meristemomyces frigidus]|nr:hypothetical protein LTR85_011782 [Meristemomyces frigidus]